MPDVSRRNRRRAHHSKAPRANARQKPSVPVPLSVNRRGLLERLLDNPNLPEVIPHLQPEVLHRVIDRCGLEDCGALITLATPAQLSAVLDLDLWRSDVVGQDELLDAERFGVWLEVMVSQDIDFAARTLAALDPAVVATALSAHISAFDLGTLEPSFASDDEREHHPIMRAVDADVIAEIGGYRIVPKRHEVWDAIVEVLIALDATDQQAFHRLLGRCRSLSSDGWERDELHDRLLDSAQNAYDVAAERLSRREGHGYVSPADARAFLQMARELHIDADSPPHDHGMFRALSTRTNVDAVGAAEQGEDERRELGEATIVPHADASQSVEHVLDVLREDGVLPQPPRALLQAAEGHVEKLAGIHRYLRMAQTHAGDLYARRVDELMLLGNTLVAGCALRSSRFTLQEASDAAIAVCNVGLEHWPDHWHAIEDNAFPLQQDLIGVFQVGWQFLYRNVCLSAAAGLVTALDTLSAGDTDLQESLVSTRELLRKHLRSGDPWLAAEYLDVVMALDMCAWAVLVGLIAEIPVIHEAIGVVRGRAPKRIDAAAFHFIAENEQLDLVREFLAVLAPMLRAA